MLCVGILHGFIPASADSASFLSARCADSLPQALKARSRAAQAEGREASEGLGRRALGASPVRAVQSTIAVFFCTKKKKNGADYFAVSFALARARGVAPSLSPGCARSYLSNGLSGQPRQGQRWNRE